MLRIPFLLFLILALSSCDQQKSVQEYIELGQNYAATKEWSSAVIEFKNAIKLDPENAQVRAALGKVYIQANSAEPAIKELVRATELGGDPNEIFLPLAKAYRLAGRSQELLDTISVAEIRSPSAQAPIYALRAQAYFSLEQQDKAIKALNAARTLDSENVEVRLAWAIYEKNRGNGQAARGWLEQLLEQDVADAWSLLGELEQQDEKLAAAEQAFTRSIALRNQVHVDLFRRALVRIGKKDYRAASEDIALLRKQGANWPIISHAEGVIAYEEKDLASARAKFEDVLALLPDYRPSQLILALIYYYDGSYQKALSLLEQYTAENTEDFQSNYIHAAALFKLEQFTSAIEKLSRLNRIYPQDFRVQYLLGSVHMARKDYMQAIEYFRNAVDLNPQAASVRLQLGNALLRDQGTVHDGRKELKRAVELDPTMEQAESLLYMSYIKEKQFDFARQIARAMTLRKPDDSQGGNLFALSFLAEGRRQQAQLELEKLRQRFPTDTATAHNLARVYLQEGALDKAKSLYVAVEQNDPQDLNNLKHLALVEARLGNEEAMLQWLETARERHPQDLSANLALANQYLKRGNPKSAVKLLSAVPEPDKESEAYLLLMAQAKLGIKESAHAIRLLKKANSKNAEIPAAHYLLAQAYALEKNVRKSREALQRTLELVPDHLAAHIGLARLDLLDGNRDLFVKRVRMLEANHPQHPEIQYLRAKVESGNQNYQEAIDSLAELLKHNPHSDVILDLAKNQWHSGDRQSAISSLALWVQEHQEDARALMLLAQFYLAENRSEEARQTYQKLDEKVPNNPVVLNNMAWLLKDDNPLQGVKYARQALEMQPDSPYIQDTLAMLYLETGEVTKALDLTTRAARALPKSQEIQLNHARVLAANNRKTEARKLLSNLMASTSSNAGRRQIQEVLDTL
jgi:putative PEP-CTERM system TPR-repeat lipoprotein